MNRRRLCLGIVMRFSTRCLIGAVASASLAFGSTMAVASPVPAPAQINSWQALAVLNGGASAIAFCGAAAAAQARTGCVLPQVDAPPVTTQVIDQPVPVPLPGAAPSFGLNPLILALGVVAAGALAYLLLNKGNSSNSPT